MLMLVLGCAAPAVADEPAKRVSVERVLMGVGLVGLGATATLDVRRRTAGRLLHHEDRAQLAVLGRDDGDRRGDTAAVARHARCAET